MIFKEIFYQKTIKYFIGVELEFFYKIFTIYCNIFYFFLNFLYIIKKIINKKFRIKERTIDFISEMNVIGKVNTNFYYFQNFIFEIFYCTLDDNFFSIDNIKKLSKFIDFFNIFCFFFLIINFYIFSSFYKLF